MKREISSARIRVTSARANTGPPLGPTNIVERLRDRIRDVRSAGIVVRMEWLDGQQASWCDLRNVRTIILDASQTASEQWGQLEEILDEIAQLSQARPWADSSDAPRAA